MDYDKLVDIGIAFETPPELAEQSFQLRDAIVATGVRLQAVLEHAPHITLFQGSFPKDVVPQLERVVTSTLQGIRPMKVTMEPQLFYHAQSLNMFWNLIVTAELQALHEHILDTLRAAPGWAPLSQFRGAAIAHWPKQDQVWAAKYGAMLAGPHFLPHITLAKLVRADTAKQLLDLRVNATEPLHFTSVILSDLDPIGRVRTILETYTLN